MEGDEEDEGEEDSQSEWLWPREILGFAESEEAEDIVNRRG